MLLAVTAIEHPGTYGSQAANRSAKWQIVVRNVLVGVRRPNFMPSMAKSRGHHLEDRSSVTSTVVRKNLSPTVFLASRSRLLNLSRTHQRILVMQPTEYCLGLNRAEVVESMARSRQRHRRIRRRIGNAGPNAECGRPRL